MTRLEAATNIVIALINNTRIFSAEEAAKAYQDIVKAMEESNN